MPETPEAQELNKIAVLREILAEDKAMTYRGEDGTGAPIHGDREVKRVWVESVTDEIGDLIDFLERFTSASNTEEQYYVDNPKVDNETLDGRWRNAYVFTRIVRNNQGEEELHIVQVLRRGYIRSLVSGGEIDWSEARLQSKWRSPGNSETGSSDPEQFLTVYWPNMAEDVCETVIKSFEALSNPGAFDPVIRGETQETDLYYLHSDWRNEDDGSTTLIMWLGQPRFTLSAYRNWGTARREDVIYHWNVPKIIAQTVLDSYKSSGKSASCSYQKNMALVDIVIYGPSTTEEDTGWLYTLVNCDYYEVTRYIWGTTDYTQYITSTTTPSDQPTATTGRIDSYQLRPNGDDTYDVIIHYRYSVERQYPTDSSYMEWTSFDGTHSIKKWRNVQDADTWVASNVDTLTESTINSVNFDMNPDCTVNGQIHKRSPKIGAHYLTGEGRYYYYVRDPDSSQWISIWVRYTADFGVSQDWIHRFGAALDYYQNDEGFVPGTLSEGAPSGGVAPAKDDKFSPPNDIDGGFWEILPEAGGEKTGIRETKYGWKAVRVERFLLESSK